MRPGRGVLIAVLLAGGSLLAFPVLTSGTYFAHVGSSILILAIAASGLNLLTGYAGHLSLAQAAFMAIGAYHSALLSRWLGHNAPALAGAGLHVWIGLLVGTLAAGLLGALLAVPAFRARGPYLAMITLAFGWIVWRILIEAVPLTGGDLGISSIPPLQAGALRLGDGGFYLVALVATATVLKIQWRLLHSPFGLLLRAARDSEPSARAAGIDVNRVKCGTFMASSAIAGLAGGLFAHQQLYINPDSFQVFDSVSILLATLLGGSGTVLGPFLGSTVLILLGEFLHKFETYRLIIYGSLLLVTLFFLPTGLMGALARLFPRYRWASPPADAAAATSEEETVTSALGGELVLEHVARSFGGLRAVKDVSLRVKSGSIHGLVGPNGAGKTTLVNLITGVYPAERGRILLDGLPVACPSINAAARAGLVRTFQTSLSRGSLSVLEHVIVGLIGRDRLTLGTGLLAGPAANERRWRHRARARRILEVVGLSSQEAILSRELPQGYRRLLEIACALAVGPRILLLDEPTAGLSAAETEAVARLLESLCARQTTILLVEHNMEFVRRLCDHITVLDHGNVIAEGAPDEALADPHVSEIYLGIQDVTAHC